jgi:SAM-dependent methyltransferase
MESIKTGWSVQNELASRNRAFYDALWSSARLHQPSEFNTWQFVASLLPTSPLRLELGPGLRPRLPIAGTCFVDVSPAAGRRLRAGAGLPLTGTVCALPFRNETFDLVSACDVIEHVADDRAALGEVSRVLKDDGVLLLAVPLHGHLWTEFDSWVGHARRYAPAELLNLLAEHHLELQQSATYGMQSGNTRWLRWGMWFLKHRRAEAMFWYNWVGMPIALARQARLQFVKGLAARTDASEVFLVCRRQPRARGVVR